MAEFSSLTPPEKIRIRLDGNNEAIWRTFKEDFGFYMLSAGFKKRDDDEKIALLINTGGTELKRVYNSLTWDNPTVTVPDQSQVYAKVIEILDDYFHVRKNVLSSRKIFSEMSQNADENLEQFITRIRTLAKDCDYSETEQPKQMRDRLVFGCRAEDLREKFFREEYEKLTFEKALSITSAYCSAKRQLAACREDNVHAIQERYQKKVNKGQGEERDTYYNECIFCGKKHKWGKDNCPAYGKTCSECSGKNHFARKCKNLEKSRKAKKGKFNPKSKGKNVNAVREGSESESSSESESTEEFVMTIGSIEKSIVAEMEMVKSGKAVKFQVDTGASVSVIPRSLVADEELQPSKCTLKAWNEGEIHPLGRCRVSVRNLKNKKKYSVEFTVVQEQLTPILSKNASEQMQLLTVNYENIKSVKNYDSILNNYSEVFNDELGNLPGVVHLTVDPHVQPVAIARCKVPLSVKQKVKEKLSDMEKKGIIIRVDEPTEWVSRMVASTKPNGDIRICIDPLALNKALQREMHPLPTFDDVLPELGKARVFSKVDLRNGYWHCELDEESSRMTTFQTPYGRYRWTRLPFGLKVSSEIFQKRLLQSLEGLTNVICVADDVLVYGIGDDDLQARENHDAAMTALLERCKHIGIRLSIEKTVLREKEVLFLGHKIGQDGVSVDPSKVEAIQKMKPPGNPNEVMQIAGMVNYLSKFLPRLADEMRPIRKLTHKDTPWEWGSEQDLALQQIKELVTTTPILSYYNPTETLVIQCDASQYGIGAVLMQNGKPLSYASRAMTPTETRYAQIEKEMLAILFSVRRFHQYTYGRKVQILTDHKPLQSIVKKPLCMAPRRLQGMMLKLQEYDVDVTYLPGKEMYIADLLSRSYLPNDKGGGEFESVSHVTNLPIRRERLLKIQNASEADPVIKKLRGVISDGWPEEKINVPVELHPYFHIRDELIAQDGMVFKGERIVVPQTMRKEIREALHISHLGAESCLRRARQCVYWPGINADLKEYIGQCDVCNQYGQKQQKETLITHELTDRPWEKIAIDLFECDGKDYLIVADYFSNWWEYDRLYKTTTRAVIDKMKKHFARFGIPSILISDNGQQFVSEQFCDCMDSWDIEHRTSSPGHQQANGLAEASVKIAKKLIRKTTEGGQDLMMALLEPRNVPTQDAGTSPAQRTFGRMTRTLLPVNIEKLKAADSETTKINRRLRDFRKEWYHDKHAKDLEILEEGEVVRMRPLVANSKKWRKAVVVTRCDERSYEVECEGHTYRRNRIDLKVSRENTSEEPTPNDNKEDSNIKAGQKNTEKEPTPNDHKEINDKVDIPQPNTTDESGIGTEQENMDTHKQNVNEERKSPRRSIRTRRKPEYLKDFVLK